MNVKELKQILNKLDDDILVVLSKDGKGTDFSPLCDCSSSTYVAYSAYSGDINLDKLTPELKDEGYTIDDIYQGKNGQKAIVLWPTK